MHPIASSSVQRSGTTLDIHVPLGGGACYLEGTYPGATSPRELWWGLSRGWLSPCLVPPLPLLSLEALVGGLPSGWAQVQAAQSPTLPPPPAGQTGKYQTYLCKGGAGSRGWGLKTGAGRPLRAPAPAGVAPPKGSLWGGTGRGEEVHPLESRAGGGEWATSCAAFQPVNDGVTLAGLTCCGGAPHKDL